MTQLVLPHIGGLIFDCDGTLADTMPAHYQAWIKALATWDATFPESLFYQLAGVPTTEVVLHLNAHLGYALIPDQVSELKEKYAYEMLSSVEPINRVVTLAKKYHQKIPMAVASGSRQNMVHHTLKAIGISHLFDAIVAAEDVVNPKPAPDTFLLAAKKIGIKPSRCLVFEDSELGLQAAFAAGMIGIDVRPWY